MSALLLPIYILIFIGLIYLVGVRPQQKRRKQLEEILRNLRPGDEVVTVSGIYGTVTEVEEGETLLIEVAEDTDIRVAKSLIARKVAGPAAGTDVSAAADADAGYPPAGPVRRPIFLLALVVGLVAASVIAIALKPTVLGLDLQGAWRSCFRASRPSRPRSPRRPSTARSRSSATRRRVRRRRARDPDPGRRPDRRRAAGRRGPEQVNDLINPAQLMFIPFEANVVGPWRAQPLRRGQARRADGAGRGARPPSFYASTAERRASVGPERPVTLREAFPNNDRIPPTAEGRRCPGALPRLRGDPAVRDAGVRHRAALVRLPGQPLPDGPDVSRRAPASRPRASAATSWISRTSPATAGEVPGLTASWRSRATSRTSSSR